MKNNKGFTVIELLVGFVFLVVITYFLLTTILTIKENQQLTNIKNKMMDIKINLTKEINSDLYKFYFNSIASCGEGCVDMKFEDATIKRLSIDTINNKIIYGDSEYELITDSYFESPFIMEVNIIDNSFTNRDNSILKIIIPIKHYDLEGNYGIRIIHPFESS